MSKALPADYRSLLFPFFKIWIPCLIAIGIGVTVTFIFFHARPKNAIVQTREVDSVHRQDQLIRHTIREIISDLNVLTTHVKMHDLVYGKPQNNQILVREFMAFANAKEIYDQVRILDITGMELLRINIQNGTPQLVDTANLQFKGKRYYFLDTIPLDAGEINMSPLDLNMERGRVERPLKPMIRFGTPLFDGNGNKTGILLVNYKAAFLLDAIDQMAGTHPGELMLLNREGYWLRGKTRDEEWGVMLSERKEISFANRYPTAWATIRHQKHGQFRTPAGLFTFSTMNPLTPGLTTSPYSLTSETLSDDTEDLFRWKLVSFVSRKQSQAAAQIFLFRSLIVAIVLAAGAAVGTGLFVLSQLRRKEAETALRTAHDELERRVAERTRDLRIANVELHHTIQELQTAESEKEQAQQRLHQAQKMEAIGTLAGGIAHDFNNILTAIIGYSELALDEVEKTAAGKSINLVLTAAHRARDLVFQILSFSRRNEKVRENILIQPILNEALKLLRASLPATIEIRSDITQRCPPTMGDPSQIHQIIMNLCTNAAHAMEETGGILHIRLYANEDPEDPRVVLVVRDTGCGMNQETLNRIYDPFFTTKEVGRGTGIGLSVVHGIVGRHEGRIEVTSKPGEGTSFQISFPAVSAPVEQPEKAPVSPMARANEHLLVVDDEPAIIDLISRFMCRLGYRVTPFSSPVAALNAFRRAPHQFDLLLTDRTMPKMTGEELAAAIRRIRPDLPMLLATGYAAVAEPHAEPGKDASRLFEEILPKPLDRNHLATAIRKALDPPEDGKHFYH